MLEKMVFDQSLFQNSTYEFKNEIKAKPALGKFYLTRLIVNKIGKHHSSPPLTSSCTCAYLTVKNYEKLDKPLDMVWCNLISFTRDFCYREISTHLFFKGRRDALLDVGSQPLLTFIVYLLISVLTKKYVKERTSISLYTIRIHISVESCEFDLHECVFRL